MNACGRHFWSLLRSLNMGSWNHKIVVGWAVGAWAPKAWWQKRKIGEVLKTNTNAQRFSLLSRLLRTASGTIFSACRAVPYSESRYPLQTARKPMKKSHGFKLLIGPFESSAQGWRNRTIISQQTMVSTKCFSQKRNRSNNILYLTISDPLWETN